MGGFDQGFQFGAQQSQIGAQRAFELAKQKRDATAAMIQNSLSNPDLNTSDRQALIQQMMGLYQPHEAPNLIQRLSGLIKGKGQAQAPVSSAAPTPPAEPSANAAPSGENELGITPGAPSQRTNELGTVLPSTAPPPSPADEVASAGPVHPFTPHPVLNKIHEGLSALGNHLSGFAHPLGSTPPPSVDTALLARTAITPAEEMARKYQMIGQNQLGLQGLKNQATIEAARLRSLGIREIAGPPVSLSSARELANSGQDFEDFATKQPIDFDALEKAVPNAKLVPMRLGNMITGWQVADQKGTPLVVGNQVMMRGEFGNQFNQPSLGPKQVPVTTSRSTTDPLGLTTTSTSIRTPLNAGASPSAPAIGPVSSAAPSLPLTSSVTPLAAVNASIAAGNAGSRKLNKGKPVSSAAPSIPASPAPIGQLDENFQLPPNASPIPAIQEGAQELLDGKDLKDVNPKIKTQSAELARQYGWSQGKFTLKELSQIDQTRSLVNNFTNPPPGQPDFMQIFEEGPIKRGIIADRIQGKPASGPLGGAVQAMTNSAALSPLDVGFIQNYRQLIGRIQGLSQLTRGGNRITEKSVERLIKELPDVLLANPQEAKDAFNLIQNEIDIALKKGTFASGAPVSKSAPKIPGNSTAIPTTNGLKITRDANGRIIGVE